MDFVKPSQEILYTAKPQCTEQAIMHGATWMSMGYPVRFVIGPTGKQLPDGTGVSHIQAEVKHGDRWRRVNGKGQFAELDDVGDGQIKSVAETIDYDKFQSPFQEVVRRFVKPGIYQDER